MRSRLQVSLENWLQWPQVSQTTFRGDGFALGSQKGNVRDNNQDRVVLVRSCRRASSEEIILGVLSDGMGGMMQGERCAEVAISSFVTSVLASESTDLSVAMAEAAEVANEDVYEEFQGGGGATLSAIALVNSKLIAINIGDSRIYTIRSGGNLVQESRDDTVSSQLAAIGEANDGAKSDLIQYVGMGPDLTPHLYRYATGELLGALLTSDGAHSVPGLDHIARHAATPKELLERVLSLSLWVGGRDNASCIVFSLKGLAMLRPRLSNAVEIISPFGTREFPIEYIHEPQRRFIRVSHQDELYQEEALRHIERFNPQPQPQQANTRSRKSRKKRGSKDAAAPTDSLPSHLIIDLDPSPLPETPLTARSEAKWKNK